jgi:hypothetical protein
MIERILHGLTHIAVLAMALRAADASADDLGVPMFSFGGFGTAGLVHSSEPQADFTSSLFKPDGAGYSHAWSADVDSRFGGQVTANFTPKLSAVVQVIVEQNYDNTYRPHVEWANVAYQFTPDFRVRAGRTVLPTFLLSDTRNVAYTYSWVRPPMEVYHLAQITVSDGVDASYQMHTGDFTNVLQVHYGNGEDHLPNNAGDIKARQSWGLSYTGEYHAAAAHIGYESTRVTVNGLNVIFDAFRQFGPEGVALANKYDVDNKAVSVITVGARYDPGQWFVIGEAGHRVTHAVFGTGNGWYLSGGYRLGALTPYLTYGRANANNLSDPGLNLSTLPPSLGGTAAGLNAALNSLLSTKPVQNTLSIGARWDFMGNAAFKLQYDHTRIGKGSSGVLSDLQPGFRTGGEFNLISAQIDFVF